MHVLVTSTNPIKLEAAEAGFKLVFPHEEINFGTIKVPSEVSDQPMGDEETLAGAHNRVKNARQAIQEPSFSGPAPDYIVGLEGGIGEFQGDHYLYAWIYIEDKAGKAGKSKTMSFALPPKVVDLVKQGKELGEADDIVFGVQNSKQSNGAIGILTGDVITRATYYTPAVVTALIPFTNADIY